MRGWGFDFVFLNYYYFVIVSLEFSAFEFLLKLATQPRLFPVHVMNFLETNSCKTSFKFRDLVKCYTSTPNTFFNLCIFFKVWLSELNVSIFVVLFTELGWNLHWISMRPKGSFAICIHVNCWRMLYSDIVYCCAQGLPKHTHACKHMQPLCQKYSE